MDISSENKKTLTKYEDFIDSVFELENIVYDGDETIQPDETLVNFIDGMFVHVVGKYIPIIIQDINQDFDTFEQNVNRIQTPIDFNSKYPNEQLTLLKNLPRFKQIMNEIEDLFDNLMIQVRRLKQENDDNYMHNIVIHFFKFMANKNIVDQSLTFYPPIPKTAGYRTLIEYGVDRQFFDEKKINIKFKIIEYELVTLDGKNLNDLNPIEDNGDRFNLKYKYKKLKKLINDLLESNVFEINAHTKYEIRKEMSRFLKFDETFLSSINSYLKINSFQLKFDQNYQNYLKNKNITDLLKEVENYEEIVMDTEDVHPGINYIDLDMSIHDDIYLNGDDKKNDIYFKIKIALIFLFLIDVLIAEKRSRINPSVAKYEFFPKELELSNTIDQTSFIKEDYNLINASEYDDPEEMDDLGYLYTEPENYTLINYGIREMSNGYILEKPDFIGNGSFYPIKK